MICHFYGLLLDLMKKKKNAKNTNDINQKIRYRYSEAMQELKELELEEEKALTRYHKSSGELRELCQKYNLKNSEWQNIIYDKREQLYQKVN